MRHSNTKRDNVAKSRPGSNTGMHSDVLGQLATASECIRLVVVNTILSSAACTGRFF